MRFDSTDDVLDFAIKREEEAFTFYTELAQRVEGADIREILNEFAREELGHKEKLLQIKKGELRPVVMEKVTDLKMADYIVDVDPSPGIGYQQALIIAMKKEKSAFRLYSALAAMADDEQLRNTFLTLAQEEAKHKLRFEIEYDENVLADN